VNGTTTSLASISKTKFWFLLKHLPLFYNRSRKHPFVVGEEDNLIYNLVSNFRNWPSYGGI
jgi:hypothetical protein